MNQTYHRASIAGDVCYASTAVGDDKCGSFVPEMPRSIEMLDSQVAENEELVSILAARLIPLLIPTPAKDETKAETVFMTELPRAVEARASRVARTNAALQHILRSLQLP